MAFHQTVDGHEGYWPYFFCENMNINRQSNNVNPQCFSFDCDLKANLITYKIVVI